MRCRRHEWCWDRLFLTLKVAAPFNPSFGASMPNDTEAMAFALIRLLHEATEGDSSEQWRTIRWLDRATDGAVALAVSRGWLQHDDAGRVALTDTGRELAEALGRPLH
jgi:hypothetical protein